MEVEPGLWGFVPTGGAEEVPYRAEYVKACKDGDLIASGGRDGNVHLSERQGDGYVPFVAIPFSAGPIHRLRFHPDGRHLVVLLYKERGLRYWDLNLLRQRFQELNL